MVGGWKGYGQGYGEVMVRVRFKVTDLTLTDVELGLFHRRTHCVEESHAKILFSGTTSPWRALLKWSSRSSRSS